jgi:metallo-beta-lactamase family protein
MKDMKLHFCGGARTVTGVNYFLETKDSKVLIDCGLLQGEDGKQKDFPYQPSEIEAVFITHAHLDHIGRLPELVKKGFKGKIFCTKPTIGLTRISLVDSAEIEGYRSRETGEEPSFTIEDIEGVMKLFEGADYGEKREFKNLSFCFRDAGHILGSAIIEFWAEEQKIVFSGDLGNPPVPLLKATEFIQEADYVIVDSVYGDRIHETKYERRDILEDTIEETVARGGTILIPSFAMERAQEILYELNDLVENNRIPQIPVFIDSPMAIELTEVYKKYPEYFNKRATYLIESGDDLFRFPGLKLTPTVNESKQINNIEPPKIIIAGSGMSTGGRILHHELRYLSDPRSAFIAICYQAKGTLGRQIVEGAKEVRIFGQTIPVKAKVTTINGYSAHADKEDIYNWVSKMVNQKERRKLKKVFAVQGEEKASKAFAQIVRDRLGVTAVVPKPNQSIVLTKD